MDLHVQDTRRRTGWFWLDNEVFEMALDPYSFMVYAYLVRIADRSSEIASISLRKIERALNVSRKKVVQALKVLEKKGMIIRKQRKGEKGNFYSNLYILTSKEDWQYPKGVVSGGNHGGVSRKPGVVSVGNHGGFPEQPPPSFETRETTETQKENRPKELPIKNNKNQKSNKYQKSSPPCRSNGGGEKEENSSGKNTKGSKKNRRNLVLESSGAGGRPEEILQNLREKWSKFVEGQSFKRLTPEQVLFFLENSALSPEETLAIIRKDDENPKIENPVGTLYASLPLKSENFRWLLKYEKTETKEEEWKKKFRQKLELLKKSGVKIPQMPSPKTEEEAEKALRDIRVKLYKKILQKMSEDEKKEIEKALESERNTPVYEDLKMSLVLEKKGFREGMFSLYTA